VARCDGKDDTVAMGYTFYIKTPWVIFFTPLICGSKSSNSLYQMEGSSLMFSVFFGANWFFHSCCLFTYLS